MLDGTDTIHVQHLRAANALWRYCDDSARIIFGGDDDGGTLERKVRRIVSERPGIFRSELHKAVSHKLTASRFDAVLAWLVGRYEIVCVPVHEGRQADRYYPGTGTLTGTESSPRSGGVSVDSPAGTQGRRVVGDAGVPEAVASPASDAVNASTSPASLRLPTIVAGDADACVPTSPSPATLTELIEWKNATGASFVRRGDSVWVTTENGLTPELRASILANQETLRAFVSADDDIPVEDVAIDHEGQAIEIELDDITLSPEAKAFFAELLAMETTKSTA